MKTANIYLIRTLGFVLMLTACVQDNDYSIPRIKMEEPDITPNTTISIVKDMYAGRLVDFNDANNEGELIIEGYVVSNDEAGNFYKVLIIQDKPENPTAAIQLDIDVTSLYALYKPGQKVYVKLNGLGMDKLNGVLHVGAMAGTSVGRISAFDYDDYIIRSTEIASIVPKVISPTAFSDDDINLLIQIDNMQLRNSEVGQPYGNANNTYTVNRYLKNCETGAHVILRNSGYSDFKNELFPEGQGSVIAVLSKYNSDYQLFIRDTEDVMFDGERCASQVYQPIDPVSLPYTQDFEGDFTEGQNLIVEGWFTTNTSEGVTVFTSQQNNGNFFAQAQAFGSSESSVETWLVSPGIIIDTETLHPVFSFGTIDGYSNGNPLTVHISTDFSGDVSSANWTQLNPVISTGNTTGYGSAFVDSGELDVSSYVGQTIYVGFKYSGGTSSITTTIQIDDFYAGPSTKIEEPVSAEGLAFSGGDFENYNAFIAGLNSSGIKDYATQNIGNGVEDSKALSIETTGASGNDYVFSALAHGDLPETYSNIKFMLKGTSSKTISINLYKTDGSYYVFNLENITTNTTITPSGSNKYSGIIDTSNAWIEITLDLSGISDLNTSNTAADFFGLKIGKDVAYHLLLDNFTME